MWRYRWRVVAAAVAGALVGVLIASMQTPVYEARALLRLADPETAGVFESQEVIGAEVYMTRRGDLVGSRVVMERSAELLGPSANADLLRQSTQVESDPDLLTLRVSAQHSSAMGAAAAANAVAEAYQQVARERTLQEAEKVLTELRSAETALQDRVNEMEGQLAGVDFDVEAGSDPRAEVIAARLESLVSQLIDVESRIREVSINAEVVGSGVESVEEASVPGAPIEPRPRVLAILGAMLGLAVGGSLAYWRAGQAGRVWTSADAARSLGAPLLGRLPRVRLPRPRRLPDDVRLDFHILESYQFILNSIKYELDRIGGSSILLTSVAAAQGKTTGCVLLGMTAGRGQFGEVVLVDGDLRARYLSQLLEMTDEPGLEDLGSGDAVPEQVIIRRDLGDGVGVSAVPAGRHGDPSLLQRPAFQEAMWQLRHSADLMIVDSAPLLEVADTMVLAGHVDGVVLLVDDKVSSAALERTRERMSFVSAPLLGFIYVSDREAGSGGSGYGYGYAAQGVKRHSKVGRVAHRFRRSMRRGPPRDPVVDRPDAGQHVAGTS
jgi:capsular polysaccharide biosynthesis protein